MRRSIGILVALAFAGSVLASPLAARTPEVEVIAMGLDHPRGLAVGPDGSVYVTEAGAVGDECLGPVCVGSTGAVSRIGPDGSLERIVTGLPSIAVGSDPRGPADVAVLADGLYVVIGLGAHPALRGALPAGTADRTGWLLRTTPPGAVQEFADIAAFVASVDPDGNFPGARVESDPRSIALADGDVVVADAGGNSVLLVDEAGTISLVATFPPVEADVPGRLPVPLRLPDPEEGGPLGGAVPLPEQGAAGDEDARELRRSLLEATPMAVAVGQDGAFYIALSTDSPITMGGASVVRLEAGELPTAYADGFTGIVDIAFGPDGSLLVLEGPAAPLDDDLAASVGGALWRVPPGAEPELILSDPLDSPAGLAVDPDGVIYVSSGIGPDGGSVLRVRA